MTETLPLNALNLFATLTGDKKKRKQVAEMKALSEKAFNMQSLFFHFINSTWRFQSGNTDRTWALMNDQERKDFKIDVTAFSWD